LGFLFQNLGQVSLLVRSLEEVRELIGAKFQRGAIKKKGLRTAALMF